MFPGKALGKMWGYMLLAQAWQPIFDSKEPWLLLSLGVFSCLLGLV